MSGLIDSILGQLDAGKITAIANQLGTDPDQTRTAVEHALPLLVGGLARNSSTPDGAEALHSALDAHTGNTGVPGVPGVPVPGQAPGTSASMGQAILGHLFGGNQAQAAQGLGQTSGLGSESSAQLLAMLAPVVMGALGSMRQKQGLDASGLSNVLGQEAQNVQQGGGVAADLMGAVLGRGAGGNLDFSGLMHAGSSLLGSMFGKH